MFDLLNVDGLSAAEITEGLCYLGKGSMSEGLKEVFNYGYTEGVLEGVEETFNEGFEKISNTIERVREIDTVKMVCTGVICAGAGLLAGYYLNEYINKPKRKNVKLVQKCSAVNEPQAICDNNAENIYESETK